MFYNKFSKLIFVVLFLGLISASFVAIIFGISATSVDDFRRKENRTPYIYPKFPTSISEFKKFPSAFEKAFNDHLPFRKYLIRIFCELSVKLLKASPHNQLLIGKEGHCFLASHDNRAGNDLIFETLIIDAQTIQRKSNYLRKKESFLRDLKVPTLMLAIPTSPLLEFHNLPSFIQKQIDPSFLETPPALRLIRSMSKEFSEKYLLFPYKEILEANKTYPLFPVKNFHWRTSRYTKLVASCVADRFEIAPYEKPGFVEFRKEQTVSDLSRLAGTRLINRNDLVYKKNIWKSLNIRDKNPSGVYENYPTFLHSLYTVNPSQKGKLLLVGNSFTYALRFDLARYFGEVLSINFDAAHKSPKIREWIQFVFENIQPDYIVFCKHNEFSIEEEFIDNFYLIESDLAKLPNKANTADAKNPRG
jgi:hypothetical protein